MNTGSDSPIGASSGAERLEREVIDQPSRPRERGNSENRASGLGRGGGGERGGVDQLKVLKAETRLGGEHGTRRGEHPGGVALASADELGTRAERGRDGEGGGTLSRGEVAVAR